MTSAADDDDRWAEAQSILDRTPTETAERRLRRSQRNLWLLVLTLCVGGLAGAVALAVWVFDGPSVNRAAEVSTGRAVAGFGLSGLGLLLMAAGVVRQFRAIRRSRGYASPLRVLTRRQRKDLLAQVRGRAAVQPARVPLGRHLAELLQTQWLAVVAQTGMLVNFVGLWIAMPSTWRVVVIGLLVPFLLVASVVFGREWRRAQRFLDQHPASGRGSSGAHVPTGS